MTQETAPSFDAPERSTIRIGVSSCLLGEKVRYDGQHKHDRYLTDTLGAYFQWVPVCPEVEVGMGIPRETIQLVQLDNEIHLQGTRSRQDWTRRMQTYAKQRVARLAAEGLSGYILKKSSPSCGMERVKVHSPPGPAKRSGRGLFATALLERFPDLPIEEEGRLCDPALRENWVERVFAYNRLQRLFNGRWKIGQLVEFHAQHKYVLLAHHEKGMRELGRLVAAAKSFSRSELRDAYQQQFMASLRGIATVKKNANVLEHMSGFLKKDLDSDSKRELLSCIDDYRNHLVPLVVPLTLVRHYVRILQVDYLRDQVYLNPHPKELALRNHV